MGTAAAKVHHLAVAAHLLTHQEPPEEQHQPDHQDEGQPFQNPGRSQRRKIDDIQRFPGENKVALADHGAIHTRVRRGHGAQGIQKIRANNAVKIVAVREFRIGTHGIVVQAVQVLPANGDVFYLTVLHIFKQIRIGNFAARAFASGEQHGHEDERGNQYDIAD